MKKILVTGSLGYIGSVLTPYLNENNFECIGYDTGFFKNCYLYPPIEQKTILDDMRHFIKNHLSEVDTVVHLAGISNDPLMNLQPETFYDPVREYTIKLAKLCKELDIKFIFASSCSVYGKARDKLLNEESETFPQTPYSLNKLQIENDLKEISCCDYTPIILRFATAFGLSPRMRFDVVVNMFTGMAFTTKKIILNSDGNAWRPNVHVKDICKAIKYSIESNVHSDKPLILNVGDTSQNYKIKEIAQIIRNEVSDSEIEFFSSAHDELIRDRKVINGIDTRTYKVSFEKVKKEFRGFKCDWTVQKGVKEIVDYFETVNFSEGQFKNIDYYRLQKMEFLLKKGYLSKDLFWTSNGS